MVLYYMWLLVIKYHFNVGTKKRIVAWYSIIEHQNCCYRGNWVPYYKLLVTAKEIK
jgi:hypothetical protein